jgi:hypothetical protein
MMSDDEPLPVIDLEVLRQIKGGFVEVTVNDVPLQPMIMAGPGGVTTWSYSWPSGPMFG